MNSGLSPIGLAFLADFARPAAADSPGPNRGAFTLRSHDLGSKSGSLRASRKALIVFLVAAVSAFAFDCALSAPNFPARPIQIFIPYGAGGVADLTMRLLAQKLTERTKQQVVVENRPGAGGPPAVKEVLRGPDGGL